MGGWTVNQNTDILSSEKAYQSLFQYQPTAAFLLEANGMISLVNDRFEKLSGKSKHEVENRLSWIHFAHPDDKESLMDAFLENLKKERVNGFSIRTRFNTGKGYVNVFVKATEIPADIRKILVQVQELDSEGLLKDYSLSDSDYRWRSYLMESLDIIVILDLSGNIIFINKTFSGGSGESVLGRNIFEILRLEEGIKLQVGVNRVLQTGKADSIEEWSSFTGRRSHYFVRISPVTRLGETEAVLLTVSDTTKQRETDTDRLRRMEAQRHRQKLEALGTLAAGVAHEINNPLTGILNYAEIVKEQVEENESLRRNVEVIIRESERISGIVRSLLGFAHKEEGIKAHVSTAEILHSSIQLLLPFLVRDGIEVDEGNLFAETDSGPEVPLVMGEPQKLKQVFLNLITNARDSLNEKFPLGGALKSISVSQDVVVRNQQKSVRVTVKDNGIGIGEENLTRIFDPFFTTKPTSVGTGLGLSVSYDIIREMGGDIEIESKEGEFACFHVILPVAEKNS